jgi:hypothetical protein
MIYSGDQLALQAEFKSSRALTIERRGTFDRPSTLSIVFSLY